MKLIFVLLATINLVSCSNRNTNKQIDITPDKISLSENHVSIVAKTDHQLIIKDSLLYDHEFLQQLKELSSQFSSITLVGDSIIVKSNQMVIRKSLPKDLPLNQTISYSRTEKRERYNLALTRISLTNIKYDLQINDQPIKKGTAILSAGFIIEPESGEEDGFSYMQYLYEDKIACETSIRIEMINANRITFSIICPDDESKNITASPILKK